MGVERSSGRSPEGCLVEEVEVLAASLHGVDDQFVAAVEAEYDDLEEAADSVESEA
jgi:predicted HAD superfamily Cof-like phosphohydrolase